MFTSNACSTPPRNSEKGAAASNRNGPIPFPMMTPTSPYSEGQGRDITIRVTEAIQASDSVNQLVTMVLQCFQEGVDAGLNIRAHEAIRALRKNPKKMSDVYPPMYTILQAIVFATTRGDMTQEQYQTAQELTQKVKGILQQFYNSLRVDKHEAVIAAHQQMIQRWCAPMKTAIQKLSQLDVAQCSAHDRLHLDSASPMTQRILSQLPFMWSKFYKSGSDEENSGEQRRHIEAIAVSALNDIMQKIASSVSLTIEEQWLLATAITDYDNAQQDRSQNPHRPMRAVSPFYHAIQLLAIERGQGEQAMRDQLLSLEPWKVYSHDAVSMESQNLKDKTKQCVDQLLVREAKRPVNLQPSPQSLGYATPVRELRDNGQQMIPSIVPNESFASISRASSRSIPNTPSTRLRLSADETQTIFNRFDAQCYVASPQDRILLVESLDGAFHYMQSLFVGPNKRAEWSLFPSPEKSPKGFYDFMEYLAPKEGLPAYAFALFCVFQSARMTAIDCLFEYEDQFIRQHLARLYQDRDKLNKIQVNVDGTKVAAVLSGGTLLGEYVAPIAAPQDEAALKKTAINLIYLRLDKEIKTLENKQAKGTLTEKDLEPYQAMFIDSKTKCMYPIITLSDNHNRGLADRMNQLFIAKKSVTPSSNSFVTPTKVRYSGY